LGKFKPGRVDHMDRDGAIAAADEINGQVDQGINPKSVGKPVKTKPTVKNPNSLKRRVTTTGGEKPITRGGKPWGTTVQPGDN
jgi:hypothetical protein